MPNTLPRPIADYLAANARLDVDAMVRPFSADARVIDNGRHYVGHAGLRKLFVDEVLPVRAVFTPETVRQRGDVVEVEGPVHGDFKGSPLRFTFGFTLAGDGIRALEIRL